MELSMHYSRWIALCIALLAVSVAAAAEPDWPQFRGSTGMGIVDSADLPLEWSETDGVAWKVETPHEGWSTPAIAGGRIWLTAATSDGHEFFVLCYDAASGEQLLYRKLFHADDPEPLGNNVNGYASPSPVVEEGRVYISFGSYGTACLDTETFDEIWRREDIECRHYRGPGSSPILHEDKLILTMDGADQQFLLALDKRTGKTVWRADRSTEWTDWGPDGKPFREGDLRKAFTTPVVVEVDGRKQLLSPGSSTAFAYDPDTGKELWKAPHKGHSSSPSPVFAHGLAYVMTGYGQSELLAIGAAKGEVAWRFTDRDMPKTPSILVVDGLVFMVGDKGIATCLDAKTGELYWSERVGGSYVASPIYANGRVYFFNVQGETTVIKAAKTFEVLAENRLESGFMSSPAVTGDALILRTKTHLYRIE